MIARLRELLVWCAAGAGLALVVVGIPLALGRIR